MSETATILCEDISEKSGEKNGRTWTKYSLKDGNGNWYGTFEAGVISSDYKGKRLNIEFEQDGKFKNLLSASPVEESPIASRTEDGEADWDLIGLRKTRCHLWGAFLQGDAMQSLIAVILKDKPDAKGADIAHSLLAFGRNLVRGAETDIYHREPAQKDEDVPF